eukprot:COSAG05_NODE_3516_length_2015_cov_1.828810_3_plen_63_part_01
MDPKHVTRCVIVARGIDHRDCDLSMNCPGNDSIESLTALAFWVFHALELGALKPPKRVWGKSR